jgi:glycosyltransferase involved in cell wall biosynthesis
LRPGIKIITIQDTAYLAVIGVFMARMMHVSCELQVHGFERSTRLRQWLARWAIVHANGIRVVSQRLKQKMITDFGATPDRIVVIPIAASDYEIASSRDYDHFNEGVLTFIAVARLVPIKRLEMQIEAITRLVADGVKCQLWIIGDGPGWVNRLRKALSSGAVLPGVAAALIVPQMQDEESAQ